MVPVPDGPGDSELVDRARRGSLDAFDELVRRYEAAAVRVASLICGSAAAEDAAQEAFVRAYRSLDRFDTIREFRPWFMRIVANSAKNHGRSERRYVDVTLRAPVSAPSPDAAETLTAEERQRVLLDALAQLPERDRIILAFRWFEEMSEREIATALQIRQGTVKSRISRAMARLREQLADAEVLHD